MTNKEIEEKVYAVITEMLSIPIDDIKPDGNLEKDYNMDEIDCLELVMGLEDVFKIEITSEDTAEWTMVQHVVNHVRKEVK